MRKVRSAQVPSGNLHCSARALAKFYAGLGRGPAGGPCLLLDNELVDQMSRPTPNDSTTAMAANRMDQNPEALFGLGVRIYEFQSSVGQKPVIGIGHAGLGGSVGFAIPKLGIGVAVTVNRLENAGRAPREILSLICAELGLQPPEALVGPEAR